jgi:hypothetical protein
MQSRLNAEVAQSYAIGPLSHPSVNARCFRSKEGHYAIVLHHGLMNLLHKHSKLWVAAVVKAYRNSPELLMKSPHLIERATGLVLGLGGAFIAA